MLRGKRVTLRAMERADIQRWHQLVNGDVELYTLGMGSWTPRSLEAIEQRFAQSSDPDKPWFMIDAGGSVIGTCGLKHWSWNRELGVAELGISILDPDFLGQGYGREAVALLLDWGFRLHNWRRIYLETLASNERAIRAYQACGFVQEGVMRESDYYNGAYVDVVIMGILQHEWFARRQEREDNHGG